MEHHLTSKLILVSACLVGQPVRYDGNRLDCRDPVIRNWLSQSCVLPVCPEVAAGMPVPRPPAEIWSGDGSLVLTRKAPILDITQNDVTGWFIAGAHIALSMAQKHGISMAVLKDGSPSCGSTYVYDGTFTRKRKSGRGVTTALLEDNRIRVFNERQTTAAAQFYDRKRGYQTSI